MRKAPKAVGPSAQEEVTTHGLYRIRSSVEPPLSQHSHPTHIVVGVGIAWHTSAHKGCPLFRRRAPAPNTIDLEGSPGGSCGSSRRATRGPLTADAKNTDQDNSQDRDSRKNYLLASWTEAVCRGARTVAEGVARWLSRRAAGRIAMSPDEGRHGGGIQDISVCLGLAAGLAGATTRAFVALDRQRTFAVRIASAGPERPTLAGTLTCECAAVWACWSLRDLDR